LLLVFGGAVALGVAELVGEDMVLSCV